MKFLDRVDKIKKEKVMKRGIVAVAVAVRLMELLSKVKP